MNRDPKSLLKVLMGGSVIRAGEREDRRVRGFTIFWTGSLWRKSKIVDRPVRIPESSVFSMVSGFEEGRLIQVAVSFNKPFTKSHLERQLGVSLELSYTVTRQGLKKVVGLEYQGRQVAKRITSRDGGQRFLVQSLALSTFLRGRLFESAMKACKVQGLVAFPAHPSWVTSRKSPFLFNLLFSEGGDMFADIAVAANGGKALELQTINELRIRAGKDGWSEILDGVEHLTLAVYPEELSDRSDGTKDSDGVIYLRRSTSVNQGSYGLLRGLAELGGHKVGIVKARGLNAASQASVGPNGCDIPVHVDGWCYDSAIKWAGPE